MSVVCGDLSSGSGELLVVELQCSADEDESMARGLQFTAEEFLGPTSTWLHCANRLSGGAW